MWSLKSFLIGVFGVLLLTTAPVSFAQTSYSISGPTPADPKPAPVQGDSKAFTPGAVYKEYVVINKRDYWRVTGPDATNTGAFEFLPNPIVSFPDVDLEHATDAEVILSYWSGHPGTDGKKFRINDNDWNEVPKTPTLGANEKQFYVNSNPVIRVPLSDFNTVGTNIFEGTACCKSWPQWGWMGIMVRIYYDPALKQGAPTVQITSPAPNATINHNQSITTNAPNASRIEVLGYYNGLDEDGDGHYQDWHGDYIVERKNNSETMALENHIGTGAQINWNTTDVPNQQPGSIKLIARAKAANGLWKVSPVINNLTLERNFSVHHLPASEVPPDYGVRVGQEMQNKVVIPDPVFLSQVQRADLYLRSWNGIALERFNFNNAALNKTGTADHDYSASFHQVPNNALQATNTVSVYSTTVHHDAEILWPGPGLVLRYDVPNKSTGPTSTPTSTPTPTITPTPTQSTLQGDIAPLNNPDGKVNIFDYNLLIANFGKTGNPGFHPADIIKNGDIDIFDYQAVLANFSN